MGRKRILFVIESLGRGGAEKVLITLLQNIERSKFNVTLCTIVDTGVHKKNIPQDIKYTTIISLKSFCGSQYLGNLVYKIKYKLVYNILPLTWVYKLFIPKGNDVEIAFVEGFTTKLVSHSSDKRSKKLAWVHTDLVNNHWIGSVYRNIKDELNSYKKYNRIIGVSKNVVSSIRTLYGLENVSVVYNPINSDEILEQATTSLLIPSQRFRIVSTGRLVEQKGYDRLLRIFKRLVDDGLDIELLLLGEGEDREKLQTFIDQHELQSRVYMPGFLENPFAEMSSCHLFVCSSRSEGYSTAVTEALILGLPVVTTECSGMDELLSNGKYGIITSNDEESLYAALKDIIKDRDKLEYYKQKSIERGQDFSLDKLMNSIEKLLDE